ncbi:hypothetical protein KCU65_g6597, partial [Aureobasidium melanogenum]
MSSQTTLSTFQKLPGELLNQITDKLDFEAALHLSHTNRYFYRIIALSNRPASTDTLAKFENRNTELDEPRLADHFACRICYCIKPSAKDAWKWTVEFVEKDWTWELCFWKWPRTVEKHYLRACEKCLTMVVWDERGVLE